MTFYHHIPVFTSHCFQCCTSTTDSWRILVAEEDMSTDPEYWALKIHVTVYKSSYKSGGPTTAGDAGMVSRSNITTNSAIITSSKEFMFCPICLSVCLQLPIPTWLLKKCASVFVPTISNTVNLSLSFGRFHPTLKQSTISPLLKTLILIRTLKLSSYL